MDAPRTLAEELERMPPEGRVLVERQLALRAQARELAARLGLDEGDTFHQLQQLARAPSERLRLGLAHGRLRPKLAD